jgi:regulation of enolase protein 1 (concanavalin A-like superfamily)
MNKKMNHFIYIVLVLIMTVGITDSSAVSIEVENFSFELPNVGNQQKCWDGEKAGTVDVPGWTDGPASASNSGIERAWPGSTHPGSTDWAGFIYNLDSSVWNLTNHTIVTGDEFLLLIDLQNNWTAGGAAALLKLSLYYDDAGTRVPVASTTVTISTQGAGTWSEYSLEFSTTDDPNSVGHKIGIEIENVTALNIESWVGMDYITLECPVNVRAWSPYPPGGDKLTTTQGVLQWNPGKYAASHEVYLDPCEVKVLARSDCVVNGVSTTDPSYLVTNLTPGVTYYWAVDEVNDLHPDKLWRGDIWSFQVQLKTAYNPNPSDGAQRVLLDIESLEWDAGADAISHIVYLGTNYNDVDVGTDDTYQDTTREPNWPITPSPLKPDTTYFWRIDENDGINIHKGDVWYFTTTLPGLGKITRELYLDISGGAVADLTSNSKYPDSPDQIDEIKALEFWSLGLDNYGSRIYGWLYPPATGDYTFWITSEDTSELWLSTDETPENMVLIAQEPGANWQSNPIALEGNKRYYILVLQKESTGEDGVTVAWQGPTIPTKTVVQGGYLSPFESLRAFNPYPANDATDIRRTPTLSWTPGNYVDKHDVYFGTGFNDVNNANTLTAGIYKGRQSDTTYKPGTLDFNTTYYWRIDEVNDVHPDKLWKGNVWSFTTGNFVVVDDFEDYNDTSNRIYNTWGDYFVNNTGMTVGHLDPPFAEQTIVHSGNQSMYMRYDNDGTVNEGTDYEKSGTLFYSEAQRQWTDAQDWTSDSVESLTLWLRGIPASVGSFTIGPPITMTGAGADIWENSDQFHYAYKRLSGTGSITAQVVSMTNTHDSAKAGVMIRESLEPGAAHAMVDIQPMNEVQLIYRSPAGAVSTAVGQSDVNTPVWVKLTRNGNTMTGEYSTDGSTWQTLSTVTIPMGLDVYIGLIVCSHDTAQTCVAEFSNVTTTGTVTGDWQSQDIGIESNTAEQLYVVLQDSTGNSVIVKHPDPAVTTFNTWIQWNIPLVDFTGVNLQAVKDLTIGVGDRDNPQAGGSGTLYIDDIVLNLPDLE